MSQTRSEALSLAFHVDSAIDVNVRGELNLRHAWVRGGGNKSLQLHNILEKALAEAIQHAYLVLGADMDNAIGINVKGDLNLRHASGGGWNAYKLKLSQLLVVCSHLTLSLQHLDAHLGLVVCCCAEGL